MQNLQKIQNTKQPTLLKRVISVGSANDTKLFAKRILYLVH